MLHFKQWVHADKYNVFHPRKRIAGCTISCRDLGVIVSCDLSQFAHINVIVAIAHQHASTILRYFVSRDLTVPCAVSQHYNASTG
jgi:hypothetical protein